MKEISRVIKMFYILIVVVAIQLYAFVKFIKLHTQKGEFYYMQIIPKNICKNKIPHNIYRRSNDYGD